MSDTTRECKDCNQDFVISEGEKNWYKKKGMNTPLRCKPCRNKRKTERDQDNEAALADL